MSLEEYTVDRDSFEFDDIEMTFDFPCCCCVHRLRSEFEAPCSACDYNVNCTHEEDKE